MLSISFSRLFYLYEDSMQEYITEERFFTCLSWLHSVFSGMITSMMMGEICLNFNESNTSFFWYSSCSKIPFLLEEENWSYNMQLVTILLSLFMTLVFNILLFFRKRQLEKVRAEGIMVNYSCDGVEISRRKENNPAFHKLNNFNRTVVTPKASFMVFILNSIYYFSLILSYLSATPSGIPVVGQFFICLTFSNMFFLNLLMETIFSPPLRNSVTDVLLFYRSAYHAVNV